ncbi:YndM family protein [Neobacillus sp. Marseille-QA0830]
MQHVYRLALKFIATLVVLGIILGMFYNFSFADVFWITAVLVVVSYILGDLLVLRSTNNIIASTADLGLAFLLVWLMGMVLTYEVNLWPAAFISAAAVTLFEYFFHQFLMNNMNKHITTQSSQVQNRPQFQTEASEELIPVKPDVRSPKDE